MARSRLSSSVAEPMTPVGTSTETSAPSFASERAAVQQALDSFCARWLGDVAPLTAEAIRYSLLGEGKRLRAILLMEAYRACGGTGDARDLAAAVEVVHLASGTVTRFPCHAFVDRKCGFSRTLAPVGAGAGLLGGLGSGGVMSGIAGDNVVVVLGTHVGVGGAGVVVGGNNGAHHLHSSGSWAAHARAAASPWDTPSTLLQQQGGPLGSGIIAATAAYVA